MKESKALIEFIDSYNFIVMDITKLEIGVWWRCFDNEINRFNLRDVHVKKDEIECIFIGKDKKEIKVKNRKEFEECLKQLKTETNKE